MSNTELSLWQRGTSRKGWGGAAASSRGTSSPPSACRAQCLAFSVEASGSRVHGLRLRVKGLGFRVRGSGFRAKGLGLRVEGLGLRVEG